MSDMEFRSWIKVPGLAYEQEVEHERLHKMLLRDHVDLGPVMSWADGGSSTVVVLAIDAADEAAAAGAMSDAVVDSLHASGLGHLYPAAVEVEPAGDRVVA